MFWLGVLTGLAAFPVLFYAYMRLRWRLDSGEW